MKEMYQQLSERVFGESQTDTVHGSYFKAMFLYTLSNIDDIENAKYYVNNLLDSRIA